VRGVITVQRGCDKFCTYCVVPYTRGRERSLPLPDLIAQMHAAVGAAVPRGGVSGQTVNSYHEARTTSRSIEGRDDIDGLHRVRFTSRIPPT